MTGAKVLVVSWGDAKTDCCTIESLLKTEPMSEMEDRQILEREDGAMGKRVWVLVGVCTPFGGEGDAEKSYVVRKSGRLRCCAECSPKGIFVHCEVYDVRQHQYENDRSMIDMTSR